MGPILCIRFVVVATLLQEEDSGDYKCSASTNQGHSSSVVSQSVSVIDSREVYIGEFKFAHGAPKLVQPPGEKESRWMFEVEARPHNLAK